MSDDNNGVIAQTGNLITKLIGLAVLVLILGAFAVYFYWKRTHHTDEIAEQFNDDPYASIDSVPANPPSTASNSVLGGKATDDNDKTEDKDGLFYDDSAANESSTVIVQRDDSLGTRTPSAKPTVTKIRDDSGFNEGWETGATMAKPKPVTPAASAAPKTTTIASDTTKIKEKQEKPAAAPTTAQLPKAAPVPAPKTTTTGQYWVQVGSFSSNANAVKQREKLATFGYIVEVKSPSGVDSLYRVRLGPYETKANARAAQKSLQSHRIESFLVQ